MVDREIKPSKVLGFQKQKRWWPSRQKVEVLGRERGDIYMYVHMLLMGM